MNIKHIKSATGGLPAIQSDTHNKIISSGGLIDLIHLYSELRSQERRLPQIVAFACEVSQNTVADVNERIEQPAEPTTIAALRHRLVMQLMGAGHSTHLADVRHLPANSLFAFLHEFDCSANYIQLRLWEIEGRLFDESPTNSEEAKAKAALLIDLLKEEGAFEPNLLAFCLEECIMML